MLRALEGCRVLVADDEPLIAMNLSEELLAEGAIVIGPTASVEDAMGLLAQEKVEAAVVDIRLGTQLAYPLADALDGQGVRFVFATGCDLDTVPEKYAHVPICQKPYMISAIIEALALSAASNEQPTNAHDRPGNRDGAVSAL
jgi:DNA-binding NtrC family response regulator